MASCEVKELLSEIEAKPFEPTISNWRLESHSLRADYTIWNLSLSRFALLFPVSQYLISLVKSALHYHYFPSLQSRVKHFL
jgi:hypothetical protein